MSEFSNFLNSIPGWLSSSLTALVGTLIGGWFTLKGVTQQAKLSKVETERESLELQLSVLKGVKGEVFTLINLYIKRMKTHIDNIKPGQMLILTFPVGDDNFTFYEQNANVIAKLNDSARDSIINIYTYSRSLIQSFKGNNKLIEDYEKILIGMADNNKDKTMYKRLLDEKIGVMVDYAHGIK
ncbi:hypothetical protein HEM17_022245, partial [Escherichia coli]|nr:hypothetical protein [Escherichia coli]